MPSADGQPIESAHTRLLQQMTRDLEENITRWSSDRIQRHLRVMARVGERQREESQQSAPFYQSGEILRIVPAQRQQTDSPRPIGAGDGYRHPRDRDQPNLFIQQYNISSFANVCQQQYWEQARQKARQKRSESTSNEAVPVQNQQSEESENKPQVAVTDDENGPINMELEYQPIEQQQGQEEEEEELMEAGQAETVGEGERPTGGAEGEGNQQQMEEETVEQGGRQQGEEGGQPDNSENRDPKRPWCKRCRYTEHANCSPDCPCQFHKWNNEQSRKEWEKENRKDRRESNEKKRRIAGNNGEQQREGEREGANVSGSRRREEEGNGSERGEGGGERRGRGQERVQGRRPTDPRMEGRRTNGQQKQRERERESERERERESERERETARQQHSEQGEQPTVLDERRGRAANGNGTENKENRQNREQSDNSGIAEGRAEWHRTEPRQTEPAAARGQENRAVRLIPFIPSANRQSLKREHSSGRQQSPAAESSLRENHVREPLEDILASMREAEQADIGREHERTSTIVNSHRSRVILIASRGKAGMDSEGGIGNTTGRSRAQTLHPLNRHPGYIALGNPRKKEGTIGGQQPPQEVIGSGGGAAGGQHINPCDRPQRPQPSAADGAIARDGQQKQKQKQQQNDQCKGQESGPRNTSKEDSEGPQL